MSRNMLFTLLFLVFIFLLFFFIKKKDKEKHSKNLINIVLIGVAGSGKGTQGDLIKDKFKLLKISAGDVLRQHRENPNGEYTAVINKYIDEGKLVPDEISNELMRRELDKVYGDNPSKKDCNGMIFDGYPRQLKQSLFLDNYFVEKNKKLSSLNNDTRYQIDLVIFIDVPLKILEDRLAARYSCGKCGEIYNKTSKPTKIKGVCDKCGSTHFITRNDDSNLEAIKKRFAIFEEETKAVLGEYSARKIVFKVDGSKTPEEIAVEISKKIEEVQLEKANKQKK